MKNFHPATSVGRDVACVRPACRRRGRRLGTCALLLLVIGTGSPGTVRGEEGRLTSQDIIERIVRTLTAVFSDRVRARPNAVPALPRLEDLDRLSAVEALVRAGRAALPDIVPMLKRKVPSEEVLRRALGRPTPRNYPEGFFNLAMEADAQALTDLLHAVAARVLGRIGPDAAAAVPHLIRRLPSLLELYSPDQPRQAWFAMVEALGAIGPKAASAVPTLRELLAKENDVREPAARAEFYDEELWRYGFAGRAQKALIGALAGMGEKSLTAAAYEVVDSLLYGAEPGWRRAALALVALRSGAVEPLRKRLASSNWRVRKATERAAPRYAQALMGWLRANPKANTAWALDCLVRLADAVYETLAEEIKSGYREFAYRALLAEAIGASRKKASRAAKLLNKLLADRHPTVRAGALRGLQRLGKRAKGAVSGLVKLLASAEASDRRLAAAALGAIGEHAKRAVEALRARSDDEDEQVREAVRIAIEQITGQGGS